MTYECRQLADSEVPFFKELLAVFASAFDEHATYQSAVPSDDYLRSLLQLDHFIVVVALDSHHVVGGLVAYVLDKFEQVRREIHIYDLAVSEAHRRLGIATGMINELKSIAKERDAYLIFVQADQDDTPAIRLYSSLGTREDIHHFDIRI
jgi:aminoglycoside 3-N-acetyltransferase I